MTPLLFVFIVSGAVLAFACISAAINHTPKLQSVSSMTPVMPTTARMTRGSEGSFGAGVRR